MAPDNGVIISIKLRIGSGYNSGRTEKKNQDPTVF